MQTTGTARPGHPIQTMLARSTMGVVLGLFLTACGDSPPVTDLAEWSSAVEPIWSFETTIILEDHEVAPIGMPSDLSVWDDGIAVADRIESDVKIFGADGQFIRTLGRLGDGPGEFRGPEAILRDQDGSVLVLDREGRLSRFGIDGRFLSRVSTPGFKVRALSPTSVPGDYLISARLVEPESGPSGAFVLDQSALVRETYHDLPESMEPYRGNFLAVLAAETDDYVVTFDVTTNLLRVVANGGDEVEQEVPILAPWYDPPAWPEERGWDIEQVTSWANRQMWGRALEHVSGNLVLVAFSQHDVATGLSRHHHVVVDLLRREQRADPGSPNGVVHAVHAGRAYVPRWDEHGQLLVDVYALRSHSEDERW